MLKIFFALSLLLSTIFASNIRVAVSANTSYVIYDLITAFNKINPNINVLVTLSSSGKLMSQIKFGASYDIFMSANMKYPISLYQQKLAITKPQVYAKGALIIISKKKQTFSQISTLLKSKEIRKIAIANPKTAPYGEATMEVLKNTNIYSDVKKKLVYGESISQTISYSTTACDIGFVSKSSLYSSNMINYKQGVHWENVDSTLYTPIDQGIVILKNGKNNTDARVFYDFINNQKAKNILQKFGYTTP